MLFLIRFRILTSKCSMDTPKMESHSFHDHFVDDVDISQYDIHKLQLLDIEERLQFPPPGIVGPRDLRWDVVYRPPRGEHRRAHVVQQCYIPSDRVEDFIEGMQCGREGAQCKFRANKENRAHTQLREGPRTALNFVRYVFHRLNH